MSEVRRTIIAPSRYVFTANARMGWRAQHQKTKHLRQLAAAIHRTQNPAGAHLPAATCHVHIGFPDRRRRDPGNWYPTVKALVDGIVNGPVHGQPWAYGLLPDDDAEHLSGPFLHLSESLSHKGTVRFDFTFTPREAPC